MPINVLITILTSSDLELLKLAVKSVFDAINVVPENYKSQITFTPIIIVNSINKDYFKSVIENITYNIQCIATLSNGRPGKGHNSEIQLFRENPQFDWFFPLDGDDIVYLTAFWQLADFIITNTKTKTSIESTNIESTHKKIDLLFQTGLDKIRYEPVINSTIITKGVYIKTLENVNTFKEYYQYFKNPFNANITDIGVPGRICLMNRRAAEIIDPIIEWEESANMLDDFTPFLAAFTHMLNGSLNIASHCNRFIYIYNLLNENNATSKFVKDFSVDNGCLAREQIKFTENISKFHKVKTNWHELQNIPFINLPEKNEFKKTMTFKIEYISSTLITHYFNIHMSELEVLYGENKYDEFIKHAQLLLKRYPELLSERQKIWLRMNLGVSYYKSASSKNIAIARAEWNLALLKANKDPNIDTDLKEIIKKNLLISANDISDAVSNF
jgi:hypothetical protein